MNDLLAQEITRMKISRITHIFYYFLLQMGKLLLLVETVVLWAAVLLFFACLSIFQCRDAAEPLLLPGRCGLSLLGLVHPVILPRRQQSLLSGHDSRPHQRPPSGPPAEPHHPENVCLLLPARTGANRCGSSCCTLI